MAMKYSDVLQMAKQAGLGDKFNRFRRRMNHKLVRLLLSDPTKPFRKYNPAKIPGLEAEIKRLQGEVVNATNSAGQSKGKLLNELNSRGKQIKNLTGQVNSLSTQLGDATQTAGKWRSRAMLGGGLAIAGTAGGIGIGKMMGTQQSGTLPSYEEWRKQQG